MLPSDDPNATPRRRLADGTLEERESPSGAMSTGMAAGTPGGPVPRTDLADDGIDGHVAYEGAREPLALNPEGAADRRRDLPADADRRDPPSADVPGSDDAGAQGRDRTSGGWGDRGIGGGRAGGTGL